MMLLTLLGILAAFYWLARETDWLRIRLPYGPDVLPILPVAAAPVLVESDVSFFQALRETLAAPTVSPKPTGPLLLAEKCQLTELQEQFPESKYGRHWSYCSNNDRRSSYQEMHIGKVTIHLSATDTKLHKIIAEVQQAQFGKLRAPTVTAKQLPMSALVSEVRTGSHREWIETDDKGHGYHQIVEEHVTKYRDSLPGKEWLEAHWQDNRDFQPAMDISVDGATKFVMTEDTYKATAVKDFMKQYKRGRNKPAEVAPELELAGV